MFFIVATSLLDWEPLGLVLVKDLGDPSEPNMKARCDQYGAFATNLGISIRLNTGMGFVYVFSKL